jgi:hypothetical protein
MRFGLGLALAALVGFAVVGCSHAPVEDQGPLREPSSVTLGPTPVPTEKFVMAEGETRQHTLLFADPKGHFGYHVSAFDSNHQHQYIVKGHLEAASKRSADALKLKSLEKKFATPGKAGFYSVTSDQPRFLLSELISGKRKEFLANAYDGLIVDKVPRVVEKDAKYVIEQKLFESPMHTNDSRIQDSVYIVYGSYGKPKKVYYLAHLIKGANNFEQILVAEFENDALIENGSLMVLSVPDDRPLKADEKQVGQISGVDFNFTVKREVYFDKRKAEGFTN